MLCPACCASSGLQCAVKIIQWSKDTLLHWISIIASLSSELEFITVEFITGRPPMGKNSSVGVHGATVTVWVTVCGLNFQIRI